MDLNDIPEFLLSAARSVGAEITSPWFYLQLGLMLAGAGIGYAAGAAAAVHARAGRQRLDRGVRGPDDTGARGHADVDLAQPQLSAQRRRQPCLRMADHPARHLGHSQRIYRPSGVAVGVAGRGPEHSGPA